MIPPYAPSIPEWMRQVAAEVNPLINGYPFPEYASAPSDPNRGFTYFDSTLAKVRTWDGAAWNNHW